MSAPFRDGVAKFAPCALLAVLCWWPCPGPALHRTLHRAAPSCPPRRRLQHLQRLQRSRLESKVEHALTRTHSHATHARPRPQGCAPRHRGRRVASFDGLPASRAQGRQPFVRAAAPLRRKPWICPLARWRALLHRPARCAHPRHAARLASPRILS